MSDRILHVLPPPEAPAPGPTPVLGRNPFAEPGDLGRLAQRLDVLEGRPPRREAGARRPPEPAPERSRGRPAPSRRRSDPPALAEIDLPESRDLWDHLLDERARRAMASLAHLVDGEVPYDRFGFSPEVARRALPIFQALYRYYFRVESRGHENLPRHGAAVLASNHAGLLPFDAAMCIVDVLRHSDPTRLPRAVIDRWAGALPFVNVFFARVGQVVGTRENFADLLEDGQLVLVFPEGMDGVRKRVTQRYRLQHFRIGFVEQALRARAPIVPMAVVGSDDQTPILFDVKPLARALGLPVAPITPTFPWLGPLGLLPYPVRYRVIYGEPFDFHERFGPEDAADARLVRYLASQVRRTVQQLVDRSRT